MPLSQSRHHGTCCRGGICQINNENKARWVACIDPCDGLICFYMTITDVTLSPFHPLPAVAIIQYTFSAIFSLTNTLRIVRKCSGKVSPLIQKEPNVYIKRKIKYAHVSLVTF